MRRLLLPATIITATALFALAGCAKKEEQAPTKTKTTAPTGAKKTAKAPSKSPTQATAPAARSEAGTPTATAKSRASNPTVAQAPAKVTYFGQVLYSWNAGKKGEAVNQFLQLNWQDPNVLTGIPALTMSEQQVASLPEAQRASFSQQAQKFSQTARDLAQAVIASTDSFIASGNAVDAKSRLDAVQQFGQALTAPERLEVVQSAGKAITGVAQEKSSAVK